MFTDLLQALADDRSRTMTQLAADLRADPGMLRLALEQCRQLGYLERMGAGSDSTACDGCRTHKACAACEMWSTDDDRRGPAGPTWWRLTDSGLRAARAASPPPRGDT